jgi:hypothetical protein
MTPCLQPPAPSLHYPASGLRPQASGFRQGRKLPACSLWPPASGLLSPPSALRPSAFGLRPSAFGLRPEASSKTESLQPAASGLRPPAAWLHPPAFVLRPQAASLSRSPTCHLLNHSSSCCETFVLFDLVLLGLLVSSLHIMIDQPYFATDLLYCAGPHHCNSLHHISYVLLQVCMRVSLTRKLHWVGGVSCNFNACLAYMPYWLSGY